jgi:flagellar biosynthesis/type III secretory pathway chaperone
MDPSTKHKTIAALEDALVSEFHIFQNLVELSRQELDALTKRDTTTLSGLVEKKEALLDELNIFEEDRRLATEDLAYLIGIKKQVTTVSELLPFLERVISERFRRIQEGIVALGREIRNLNRNNLALAKTALEWADATQAYLLSLHQPDNETYQVPGKTPKRESAVRSFDQWV